ncbi:hypothetical protein SEPCBS57363_005303 [Sporothrix epigloea]|uniref:Uncharacterized protein n=1 Tax=Sporothrix epigloea TaxID=1892477 RepID=A0ABP0DWR5_9PEZI
MKHGVFVDKPRPGQTLASVILKAIEGDCMREWTKEMADALHRHAPILTTDPVLQALLGRRNVDPRYWREPHATELVHPASITVSTPVVPATAPKIETRELSVPALDEPEPTKSALHDVAIISEPDHANSASDNTEVLETFDNDKHDEEAPDKFSLSSEVSVEASGNNYTAPLCALLPPPEFLSLSLRATTSVPPLGHAPVSPYAYLSASFAVLCSKFAFCQRERDFVCQGLCVLAHKSFFERPQPEPPPLLPELCC